MQLWGQMHYINIVLISLYKIIYSLQYIDQKLGLISISTPIQMHKQQPYDSYGFKTTSLVLLMQQYLKDPQRDKQRLQIWQKILQQEHKTEQSQKLIQQQVRKGIPDQIRPQAWRKLIIPPLKQYQSIVVKEQLKQIDRDINRTIPTNKRQSELKDKLKNMLNVIAVAFPKMSYCQGLNFIAANLLLILSEKQTYDVMYHILHWQGHEQLMSDLNNIHTKLHILNRLIKKHYPILSKHLQSLQIDPILYASSWFITLYTNCLPCQYVFRIFEVYFIQGEKILYRVALQILKEKKKILKKLNTQEDLIAELKNYEQFNKAIIDKFFAEMFQINFSRKEIKMYQEEYEKKFKKDQ